MFRFALVAVLGLTIANVALARHCNADCRDYAEAVCSLRNSTVQDAYQNNTGGYTVTCANGDVITGSGGFTAAEYITEYQLSADDGGEDGSDTLPSDLECFEICSSDELLDLGCYAECVEEVILAPVSRVERSR